MFVQRVSGTKVQLIVVSKSIVEVILSFHSSKSITLRRSTLMKVVVVQNFIDYYGCVCFYPRLTLVDKIGIVFDLGNNQKSFDAVQKYVCRGFKMLYTYRRIVHACSCFSILYTNTHLVADHQCFNIDFVDHTDDKRNNPWQIQKNTWALVLCSHRLPQMHFKLTPSRERVFVASDNVVYVNADKEEEDTCVLTVKSRPLHDIYCKRVQRVKKQIWREVLEQYEGRLCK